jgi:ferrous iron transport protein A
MELRPRTCGETRHQKAIRNEKLKPLADVSAGKRAAVVALEGGKGFVNRMASLGFTPGTEVQMVQNYRYGPIIALVRGARVALGRRESSRVWVEQAEQ